MGHNLCFNFEANSDYPAHRNCNSPAFNIKNRQAGITLLRDSISGLTQGQKQTSVNISGNHRLHDWFFTVSECMFCMLRRSNKLPSHWNNLPRIGYFCPYMQFEIASCLIPSGFPTQTLHVFCPICAAYPALLFCTFQTFKHVLITVKYQQQNEVTSYAPNVHHYPLAVAYPGIFSGVGGVQQINLRTERMGIWWR
jgi:hypothetical protein